MVFHMKTTLNIDDGVMNRLKEEAARRGTTMSSLVEAGIRLVLEGPGARSRPPLPPMPTFHGGEPLVDVADRCSSPTRTTWSRVFSGLLTT